MIYCFNQINFVLLVNMITMLQWLDTMRSWDKAHPLSWLAQLLSTPRVKSSNVLMSGSKWVIEQGNRIKFKLSSLRLKMLTFKLNTLYPFCKSDVQFLDTRFWLKNYSNQCSFVRREVRTYLLCKITFKHLRDQN